MRGLLGVGQLVKLEVKTSRGKRTLSLRQRYLGWDTGRKAFHICTIKGRQNPAAPSAVAAAHRRFHGAPPKGAFVAEVPQFNPRAKAEFVGLVQSLVYTVPDEVRSPEKNRIAWHHAFGDTGHKGGSHYPDKVMPALYRQNGHLFIVRRKGNIFNVDNWLRG